MRISRILFFFIFLSSFAGLFAYEVRLYPPTQVYGKGHHILADFKTSEEIMNEDFKEYLKYGIVIHFNYSILLHKKKIFFDEVVSTKNLQLILYYDLWKKKIILIEYQPEKKEMQFDTLEETLPKLKELHQVSIIRKSRIDPQGEYYFKTRVTTKISQFKSYFHIIFSLLSIIKYKTTYLKSETYRGGEMLGALPG